MPLGPDPGRALPAPARAGHGAGPAPAEGRPELPVDRGGPPAGRRRYPLRAVRPAVRRRGRRRRSRTPPWPGPSRSRPPEPVAVLTLARGDLSTADALAQAQLIDAMAFNPWNTTDEFRPLGNLNRARKAVYDASSAQRLGYRWQTETAAAQRGARRRRPARCSGASTGTSPWYRLPVRLGPAQPRGASGTCCGARNLFDSEVREAPPQAAAGAARPARRGRPGHAGRSTGPATTCPRPRWAAVGSAFGRNLRPDLRPDLFDEPNPVIGQPAAAVPRARSCRPGR